ncbi:MAG: molybdopterin-dependent oxidoreductase [Clostridiales bacterium]|nr:molybdopterin-dependent oxidoreductase [Clostridiales bacterium]
MKNKTLFILFVLILSLILLTACSSNTPSAPNAEEAGETQQVEESDKNIQDENKTDVETSKQDETTVEKPEETTSDTDTISEAEKPKSQQPEKLPEETPQTKPDEKTLLHIEGSGIENPITLSLDELKSMKDAYYEDDFFSLNSYGTEEYFHFKGIKIKAILDKGILKDSASTITFIASDGYKHEMSVEQTLKEDYIDEHNPEKRYPVIIAWHENGKDYDPNKGAPFRLVIGQKEPGDVNKPQWVQNIVKIIIE